MKKQMCVAIGCLTAFAVWTILVSVVDVAVVGPREAVVGFSTVNRMLRDQIGVNMTLYHITDWMGLIPVFVGFGFAILGLVQWIRRRYIWKVDTDILVLGAFYLVMLAVYLLFESVTINYRPVLIDGYLETSYPSSTTLLVLCVMPTAAMQLKRRIQNRTVRLCVIVLLNGFVGCMVLGRLLSGVHWVSDIVGGVLLSAGLVSVYAAVCSTIYKTPETMSASGARLHR